MKRNLLIMSVLTTLALSGCVPSLNPLYTEKDLVFDPALIGTWAEENNSSDTWAFEKDTDKSYKLVVTEKGDAREYKIHLVKLGSSLFLDFYPEDSLREVKQDFYKAHLVPAHLFAKVSQIGDTLRFALMNPDWLDKLLKQHPDAISHETIENARVVLTASTKALQEFVSKYAGNAEAFGDPVTFKRKAATPRAEPAKK